MQIKTCQRRRKGRGRVAVHQHEVRLLLFQNGLEALQDPARDVEQGLAVLHDGQVVVRDHMKGFQHLIQHLAGGRIKVYDPYVKKDIVPNQYHDFDAFLNDVDMVVVLVGHDEIRNGLDKLKGKVVLDTRNICGEGVYKL